MSGAGGPSDAELVAAVLGGDRQAFAEVYDRYADRLHDFAHSMLRDPEEAADSVADSFVVMAEKLGQLRDPERLRPWLYSVVRHECLRRLRARSRVAYGGDERLTEMSDDARGPDREAEVAAMRTLVWEAAAGLGDRDRALLDLHLRQGLEGTELAEAMGISPGNAYTSLNRLRAQVERSLGALLIAKMGRAGLHGAPDDPGDVGRAVLTARAQAGRAPRGRLRRLHASPVGDGQPDGPARRRAAAARPGPAAGPRAGGRPHGRRALRGEHGRRRQRR